jgi:hypothetical protein
MRTTDTSRPEKSKPDRGEPSPILGPLPLLKGEDPKIYDGFLTKIFAATRPTDILEQILAHDYAHEQIEVLRYRRLKAEFIRVNSYKGLAETLVPIVGRARAETLAEGWAAQKSDIVEEVNKILASAGLSTDSILAQTFSTKLDEIERMEHLIARAEARRNAALRELDRHRQTLGRTVRRVAAQLEEDQTRVIASAPVGRHTAWFDR